MKKSILLLALVSIFACQKDDKRGEQDLGHEIKSTTIDTLYGSDHDSGSSVLNDYSMIVVDDGLGSVTINRTLDQSNSSSYGTGVGNLTPYSWIDLEPGWVLDVEEVTDPEEDQEYVWFVPFSLNAPIIKYNAGLYTGPQKAYYCECAALGQPTQGSCHVKVANDAAGTRSCVPNSPTSCSNCYGYTFYTTGGVFVVASSLDVDGASQ